MEDKVKIFIGNIIHCTKPFTVHTFEPGFIAVKGCKITAVDNISSLESYKKTLNSHKVEERILSDSQILIPGLVDTHIHAPQYPNAGLGYDKPLLEWLQEYTYPLEKKYKDLEFSKKVYSAVVKKCLSNGTTTACYFASLFTESCVVLADIAIECGQRAFIGKLNMTKLAPSDYLEKPDESIANTVKFIEAVLEKKSSLVKPIITPRFALSVEMDTMCKLSILAKEYNLPIQTHISENLDEIKEVNTTYGKSYAETYDEAGLLTNKTVLAHGIYLSDSELRIIANQGTSISHCPESNANLNSGACDVKRLVEFGVNVGLGTDVSGGASPSIISAMRSAITNSFYVSLLKKTGNPLTCYDAFYLATLGGAKALGLNETIGNFEVGKEFDALIIDINAENSPVDYLHTYTTLELLQKFVYTGDDRSILATYVAGRQVK